MCRSGGRRCRGASTSKAAAAKRARSYRARRRGDTTAAPATEPTGPAAATGQETAVNPDQPSGGDVTPHQPDETPRTPDPATQEPGRKPRPQRRTARNTRTARTQTPRERTRARGDVTRSSGRREVEYYTGDEFPNDEFPGDENDRVWMVSTSPVPTAAPTEWGRDDNPDTNRDTTHDGENATVASEDNPMPGNDSGPDAVGDVTPPTEPTEHSTGPTVRVINYAAPGATVGRQADVVHGDFVVMGSSTSQAGNDIPDAVAARMEAIRNKAHRATSRHTTTGPGGFTVQMGPNNVAGQGEVVAFQVGKVTDQDDQEGNR
ncbi:MAG: hypothetical protein WBA97_24710 [Actinophytocola sp.]|uniref:hypothetical protein n=1 Tax=Actinophytocola sp. TaxID=1872138 RepID=UPI003C777765